MTNDNYGFYFRDGIYYVRFIDENGKRVKTNSGFDILIDQNHWLTNKKGFPFTLAEELAHIKLHSKIYEDTCDINDYLTIKNEIEEFEYKKIEQQARCVASCLLLPTYIFDSYVIEYVKLNKYYILNNLFFSKEDLSQSIAKELSEELQISESVINIIIIGRYPNLIIDKILDILDLKFDE